MTLQEFKAWFQGYTEDMKSTPTKDQWTKIKKRVSEIDGTVTTYPVFIDRYVQPLYPSYPSIPNPWPTIWCTSDSIKGANTQTAVQIGFTALGKTEYLNG